ncbi:MAG: DUF3180 domain-containing protein [Actinomycetales bacterium]
MIRARSLAALAVAGALLGALVAWWMTSAGLDALPIPWSTPVVLLTMAVVLVVLGLPVRRWTRGERTPTTKRLDPLRATRTVALAKAAGYAGAIFTGWYFGLGVGLVTDLEIEPRLARFEQAMAATLASLALCSAGLVVERWCRRPPSPDEDDDA